MTTKTQAQFPYTTELVRNLDDIQTEINRVRESFWTDTRSEVEAKVEKHFTTKEIQEYEAAACKMLCFLRGLQGTAYLTK